MGNRIGARVFETLLAALVAVLPTFADRPEPQRERSTVRVIHSATAGVCTFEIYERPTKSEFVPKVFQFQVKVNGKPVVVNPPNSWKEEDLSHCHIELIANQKSYSTETRESDDARVLDFDGDGTDEVVVVTNSGGQGCCNDFYVFKVSPSYRDLAHLTNEGYGEVNDIDGDREPEITLRDSPFYVFQNVCSASAPAMYEPLHFRKGKFVPDVEAMTTEEPTTEEWNKWKGWAVEAFANDSEKDISPGFWRPIVELWYRGHPKLARKFFDENWPQQKQGKEEFWQSMLDELRTSHYWDALKALNGW